VLAPSGHKRGTTQTCGAEASPAAISGAVRYLTDTHLVVRERNPAGRGDLSRVRDGDI
jgi:hypothetical protein